MKSIKTSISAKLAALLVGAALLGLISQGALAAGTTSGTTISNSATLAYSVGGVAQTGITSAAATFLVDEKINLTVAGGTTTNVVPGATVQVTTFTVTNNANSPLDFTLAANQVASGQILNTFSDNFDATGCSVFVDVNGNGTYEAGTDTATFVDELAADASRSVFVVCSIPIAQVNGDAAIVGLTATAVGTFTGPNGNYVATPAAQGAAIVQTAGANTANVDIVFGDIAGTEGDIARDAKHSARDVYHVVTAALSVNKTAVLLCDPFNGIANPKNIPGAMTQWTIAIQNTGGTAATLTTITDTLAASILQDANLVVPVSAATCSSATGAPASGAGKGFKVTASAARNIGGTPAVTTGYFTTANDADGVELNAAVVTATFSTILPTDAGHLTAGLLNAGETVSVIFNTTVQ